MVILSLYIVSCCSDYMYCPFNAGEKPGGSSEEVTGESFGEK